MLGAQRKAALCHLLDQETQLIAAIGRHKLHADTENKQRAIQNFLEKVSVYMFVHLFVWKMNASDIKCTF